MPSGDAIPEASEYYDEIYYSGGVRPRENEWQALSARGWRSQISLVERELGRKGRFLDVGCGTGSALAAARGLGWDAEGVEPSESAAAAARARGVTVRSATLEGAAYPAASFDLVWLSHVVEHVPDPVVLLREVARVLAPAGMAMISVPNSRAFVYAATNLVHRLRGRYGKDKLACSLAPPGHLYAFDERSLRVLLSKAGLLPEKLLTTGKGDPTFFPVLTWKGAGKLPYLTAVLEWNGRKIGRGTLLQCYARKPA
ncbi:MAG TPA: class I SAM-dependent methyltransferase [Gammaproteobacteria bacterium]|nr:class I SAM-dependent methyltransferase [Gammaproteobacteria bacterium]